jgi:5-methylcytosine-specific restriction endonuclease McrA
LHLSNKLRDCFLPPIELSALAADHLHNAADALLRNDLANTVALIEQANIRELWLFARKIMGLYDDDIHRYKRYKAVTLSQTVPPATGPRMPNAQVILDIFRRDGFRCRYCGVRVIHPRARTILMAAAPKALLWPSKDDLKHAAFYALTAVADHVIPFKRGGTSDPANMVTACQCCNYGKGDFLLTELELTDPRDRPPVTDSWDGLTRLLNAPSPRPLSLCVVAPPPPTPTEPKPAMPRPTKIAPTLEAFQPAHAQALSHLLTLCEAAGVTWALNKALLLRLATRKDPLEIVGINANGTVEIPWSLSSHKTEYKCFVDRLAETIEGSETYVTSKGWWRLHRHGRKLRLPELLDAGDALVQGIVDLRAAIETAGAAGPT